MTMFNLRVATLNIGGGEKTFEEFSHDTQQSRLEALEMLIKHLKADLLCLQEVSQFIDADGLSHSLIENINQSGDYDYYYFGETLSMGTHMQVKKDVMVKGVFNDWMDWSKGNAIHARIPFTRLGDPQRTGMPRNIPLYQPKTYEGNRDTDPRFVLLSRLNVAPFPFVATLHLTTLVGERQPQPPNNKIEKAQLLRHQQINRFLDLVNRYILKEEQPLILAGDFNATKDESCVLQLLESGFVRLEPENEGPSHAGSGKMIDHIFFYPRERLVDYQCHIDDGDLSKRASDHLPIVADMQIK